MGTDVTITEKITQLNGAELTNEFKKLKVIQFEVTQTRTHKGIFFCNHMSEI